MSILVGFYGIGLVMSVLSGYFLWCDPTSTNHTMEENSTTETKSLKETTMTKTNGHCAVCSCKLLQPVTACPTCETPHHTECWEFNGNKCAIYGCGNMPAVVPQLPNLIPLHPGPVAPVRTEYTSRGASGSSFDASAVLMMAVYLAFLFCHAMIQSAILDNAKLVEQPEIAPTVSRVLNTASGTSGSALASKSRALYPRPTQNFNRAPAKISYVVVPGTISRRRGVSSSRYSPSQSYPSRNFLTTTSKSR